ncbi:MAG: glycoside hydrolase family 88 protein [Chloroflexota bacterium]
MNQPTAWSVRMADSFISRHPQLAENWRYEAGVVLKGIELIWRQTGETRYWDYLRSNMDYFVQPDGSIRTYRLEEYNLDQINQGKLLFPLFQETGDERYRQAAFHLHQQLETHPRTSQGGFWHKQIYPHQLWLDGVYMAGPFLAEFATRFLPPGPGAQGAFDEVTNEILLVERHTRDARTGLLYHGWDESRQQRWADPQTGCSPHFWGRAIGWYMMALVDVLEILPAIYPRRSEILAVLQRLAPAVIAVQDKASHVWFQVLDQGQRAGNYLEASASCMFTYALARGVRLGYLDPQYLKAAEEAYAGILRNFILVETLVEGEQVNLTGICSVAGLGGDPYRDGSYEYYIGEKVVANDYKGVGAFLMASTEIERSSRPIEKA